MRRYGPSPPIRGLHGISARTYQRGVFTVYTMSTLPQKNNGHFYDRVYHIGCAGSIATFGYFWRKGDGFEYEGGMKIHEQQQI